MAWCEPGLRACVARADERAQEIAGLPFRDVTPQQRSAIFASCEAEARGEKAALAPEFNLISGEKSALAPFATLLAVAFEGYYGGTSEPAGWGVAGFRAVPAGVEPVDPDPIAGVSPDEVAPHYEVIVVGAGAGGGCGGARRGRPSRAAGGEVATASQQ
jgi:hypothetical protein